MSRPEPVDHPLSIWIVNPLDDIPGEHFPAQRAWSLARLLAARGHDVTWWSATWSHRRKTIRTAPLDVRDDEGFAVRLVAVRRYDREMSLARFASHRDFGRTFERLANESIASGQLERPDIILASMPPIDGPEAAARLAKRLDAEFVVDLLDVWPEALGPWLPKSPLIRGIVRPFLLGSMQRRRDAAIAAADAIAAPSQAVLDAMPVAAGADVPKHLCPLGAYPQQFPAPPRFLNHVPAPEGLQLPQRHAANNGQALECVHAGTLGADEDLDTLVAAARQLSASGTHATIHVVGDGQRQAPLRASVASLAGPCRVVMHGALHREAYVDLLARCDAGLVLTRPESVTSIPYEASDYAAAGLAVVSGLPADLDRAIVDQGAGMRYAPGDPTSLAGAIKTLANDRQGLLARRQAARRFAETTLDREKLMNAFADWLESLRAS
ncbi:MAG: glycosyltransferase [Planctomycetia bacterium]